MANVLELFETFQNGFGKTSRLMYPLENQADYLGKITFSVVDDQSDANRVNIADTQGVWENLKENLSIGPDRNFSDYFLNPTDEEKARALEIGVKLADFLTPGIDLVAKKTSEEKFKGTGGVNDVQAFRPSSTGADKLTSRKIQLYLPKAIAIADAAIYDNNFQLGLIGGAIEKGTREGKSALVSAANAVGAEGGALLNTIAGRTGGLNQDLAAILAMKVAAAVPVIGDASAGAIQGTTRTQINPNTRALFKNVPIRNFAFQFSLLPTSQQEAMEVEKIIKAFREELYPTAIEAGGIHIGYKFPNRFIIKVRYNNKDIQGIKFLPVHLQSFQAVYNSNSAGMHRDGRFNQVDISMAFTETRALTKADIRDGGY
jgi:hypothetical protein